MKRKRIEFEAHKTVKKRTKVTRSRQKSGQEVSFKAKKADQGSCARFISREARRPSIAARLQQAEGLRPALGRK